MSDRRLVLRHGNQSRWADVTLIVGTGRDEDTVHLMTLTTPDEGMELFRLLDEELTRCATCDKPMWTVVAGWCADGDRAWCCEHPPCSALECDRNKAVGW